MEEKSEQSLLLASIYAFMLVWFGGLLGFICLMLFPLNAYPNMQQRAKVLEERGSLYAFPRDAYYIEGPISRSREWTDKRQQLIDASAATIQVSAGEINAWLDAKFRVLAVAASEGEKGLVLRPDRPNVGITADGATYLNLPAKISGYGLSGNYVLSAKVRYSEGAPPRLLVDRLQIGGAAVPLPGIIGAKIVSGIINSFSSAEEYALIREAWSRVQSVETADGAFVFILNRP
jgi:hypothetical protein